MITVTGRLFEPGSTDLVLDDVLIPLSRLVRWGGTAIDWTVLDHSIFVALLYERWLRQHWKVDDWKKVTVNEVTQCALFHDAHEFITGDVPRPWKGVFVKLRETQAEIQRNIEIALDLAHPSLNILSLVKYFDDIALHAEARHVLPPDMSKAASESLGELEEPPQWAEDLLITLMTEKKVNYPKGRYFIDYFKELHEDSHVRRDE